MNFTLLEVVLLSVQILLVPLFRYVLTQQREEILGKAHQTLNKYQNKMEDMILMNANRIAHLEENIKHRGEMAKLRLEILQARIKDIEIYLSKKNGFQTRELNKMRDEELE